MELDIELSENLKQKKRALTTSPLLKRNLDEEKAALVFIQRYEQALLNFLTVLEREIEGQNSSFSGLQHATEELEKKIKGLQTEVPEVTISAAREAITAFENALPSLTTNQKLFVAGSALVVAAIVMVLGFALGATIVVGQGSTEFFWWIIVHGFFSEAIALFSSTPFIVGSLLGVFGSVIGGAIVAHCVSYNLEQANPLIKEGQAVASAADCVVEGFANRGWKESFFKATHSSENSKNEFREGAIWRVKEETTQGYAPKGTPNEAVLSLGALVEIVKSYDWDEEVKHPTTENVMVRVGPPSGLGQTNDRWPISLIDPDALEFVANSKKEYLATVAPVNTPIQPK